MSVVVIGELSSERSEGLRLAILRAKEEPAFYWDLDDAREAVAEEGRPVPRAILVDAVSVDVEAAISWVRRTSKLFALPVVVLLPAIDQDAFREVHSLGADDAVGHSDFGAITRRLSALSEFDPTERPDPVRGDILVAHSDVARRATLGRILRIAGFNPRFAYSAADFQTAVQQDPLPELVVAADDLGESSGCEAIRTLRQGSGQAAQLPVILLGPRSEQTRLREQTAKYGGVRGERELAPPDNLLFLTNELTLQWAQNQRSSARLLHATLISFRVEGAMHPSFGLTYNLSGSGLYARTLDAPMRGARLWLELVPPGVRRACHIRAEVMWGQRLTSRRGSPPGFGVRFRADECPEVDLRLYQRGYDELAVQEA